MHLERVVARYALTASRAEAPYSTAALLSEARQLEDRLGLSPMAMLRLRWAIEDDEQSTEPSGNVTALDYYRGL